jgi:hypothetical protein
MRRYLPLVALVLAAGGLLHSQAPQDVGDPARNRLLYGHATMTPSTPLVAGSWGTWTLTLTVGRLGVDTAGQIMLAMRSSSDWGPWQTTDAAADNYVSVRTSGQARISMRYENRRTWRRPWYRGVVITVDDGDLREGDTVTVTLGDRTGGGRGVRVQTMDESHSGLRFIVDAFGTGQAVPVLASPSFPIVAGTAELLEVVAPTESVVGQPFWLQVRAKDAWGNPATSFRGTVYFEAPDGVSGLPSSYTFVEADTGFHRFDGLRAGRPGVFRVRVTDDQQSSRETEGNPVVVRPAAAVRPFWADLHGQSNETVGLGTVDEYFAYARGFAAMDVSAHQANDFQITREAWRVISEASRRSNVPGEFVAFLGYEWSGNTSNGGDHNVLFLDDDQPLYHSSRAQVDEDDPKELATDRYTIRDLAETLLKQHRALLIPHIGGRPADLDFFDARLMPGLEIDSVHGQFEWFLEDALKRGLKVGFFAASDDHMGNPGEAAVTGDRFFLRGGHTCILATALAREAIWEALERRRFYATTGERIQLGFRSGEHLMGEEIASNGPVRFDVEVAGTSGIERVDLFRGLERVYRYTPSPLGPLTRIKVAWSGAETTGRARATTWDGALHLSAGRIRAAEPYRFDNGDERSETKDERTLTWHSKTAGDEDGVILDVDGTPEALLTFEAGPVNFSVQLGELGSGERVFPAGGLRRQVAVSKVAAAYPREATFDWTDTVVPRGISAYWVRVQQQDGAVAWASPIYVVSNR